MGFLLGVCIILHFIDQLLLHAFSYPYSYSWWTSRKQTRAEISSNGDIQSCIPATHQTTLKCILPFISLSVGVQAHTALWATTGMQRHMQSTGQWAIFPLATQRVKQQGMFRTNKASTRSTKIKVLQTTVPAGLASKGQSCVKRTAVTVSFSVWERVSEYHLR